MAERHRERTFIHRLPVTPGTWPRAGTHREPGTGFLRPRHSALESVGTRDNLGVNRRADLLRRQALAALAQSQRRKILDALVQILLG